MQVLGYFSTKSRLLKSVSHRHNNYDNLVLKDAILHLLY